MSEKKNWVMRHPIWTGIIIVFLLMIIIGISSDDSQENKSGDSSSLTIEQKIQKDAQKILGADEITSFSYFEETGDVVIHYKAGDYASEITLHDDHIKLYEKLYDNYDLVSVSIFSYMNFYDTYGQEKELVAVRSKVTKETASKVNWDNLLTYNLHKVVDDYYIRPVLKD